MIHYVPLQQFPSDARIPEQFSDRFWYDEDRACLAFDGPMWKSTFDHLQGLSRDFHYQRAVEELFRVAVPEDHLPQRRRRWLAVLLIAALILLALGSVLWPLWSRLLAGK